MVGEGEGEGERMSDIGNGDELELTGVDPTVMGLGM